jgi:hypothetical protein
MAKLELVMVAAVLAGCAGLPVSSGGADEILLAAAETIRILWNPQLTTEAKVRAKAVAFCGGREVDPIESSAVAGALGELRVSTWQCRAAAGSGSGM